jgi:hypothetical protein
MDEELFPAWRSHADSEHTQKLLKQLSAGRSLLTESRVWLAEAIITHIPQPAVRWYAWAACTRPIDDESHIRGIRQLLLDGQVDDAQAAFRFVATEDNWIAYLVGHAVHDTNNRWQAIMVVELLDPFAPEMPHALLAMHHLPVPIVIDFDKQDTALIDLVRMGYASGSDQD